MPSNSLEKEQLVLKAALANGIVSRKELANFMAQVSHESGGFRIEEENLNYSAKRLAQVWPKRYAEQNGDPNQKALQIANNPEKIANKTYANRMGNGNESTGDGYRYRGRGFIQLTGKDNYEMASKALNIDLINNPDLAKTPEVAAKIALLYWEKRVPQAHREDIRKATISINGGLHGFDDRLNRFNKYYQKFTPEYLQKVIEDEKVEKVLSNEHMKEDRILSKYDEVNYMLQGLLSDADGSYTKKLLAEHSEQIALFEEKIFQSIENEKQQDQINWKNQAAQQEEQQKDFSRSFS